VNFVDGLFVQGKYQIKPPLPFTPGGEVAGDVVAIGDGVEGVAVGDRVLAMSWLGGFASHVELAAGGVVPIPGDLSYGQAAALVQSYGTMLFAMTRRMQVRAGEWVLVLGAGGGIGLAAIDVAHHLGARVIAAASSDEKLAAATKAGAEATIDYEREDLKARAREISGGGVDVVVDPVGGRFADAALRSLGWMGRYLVIGFAGGDIPALPANQVLLNNRTVVGIDWGAWTMRDAVGNRDLLAELMDLAGSGGAARFRRWSPLSTRSTTWCAPSPTCKNETSPARSCSCPERVGRRVLCARSHAGRGCVHTEPVVSGPGCDERGLLVEQRQHHLARRAGKPEHALGDADPLEVVELARIGQRAERDDLEHRRVAPCVGHRVAQARNGIGEAGAPDGDPAVAVLGDVGEELRAACMASTCSRATSRRSRIATPCWASSSSFQPKPTPSTTRPPLRWSRVAIALAVTIGSR